MKHRLAFAVVGVLGLLLPGLAQATGNGTTTASIAVSATIPQLCSITTSAMTFGNYDPVNGTSSTSSITVTCSSSDAYTVDLNAGSNGTLAGASTTRALATGTGSKLSYNLYLDAAHTQVWATGSPNDLSGTANLTQVSTVYGMVPSGQTTSPAGSYSDTVTATLNY